MYATVKDLPTELHAKGIATVSNDVYSELNCSVGDPILVSTPDSQQRVLQLQQSSESKRGTVELGEHEKRALEISQGSKVSLSEISWSPAKSITVCPPPSLPDEPYAYKETQDVILGRAVHPQKWLPVKCKDIDQDVSEVFTLQTNLSGISRSSDVGKVTEDTEITFVSPKSGPDDRYSCDPDNYETVYQIEPSPTEESQTSRGGQSSENYGYNEFRVPGDVISDVSYDDIGGLDDVVQQFREVCELPFEFPELRRYLGIEDSAGFLLSGPPGTGKTLLAKALANETDTAFYRVDGPEVFDKQYGEPERRIRELFEAARKHSPSIVYFDEFDSLGQTRGRDSTVRRVVGQLLSALDGLEENDDVIVIASTNDEEEIDKGLRRPGRFGKTIEVGIPSKEGRREIFEIHTEDIPLADEVDLDTVASRTHGFTGADITSVLQKAQREAFDRHLSDSDLDVQLLLETNWSDHERKSLVEEFDDYEVMTGDFDAALEEVEPTELVEHRVEVPETNWEDIGGLEGAKSRLREAVVTPLEYPEAFEAMGISSGSGILLAGPPGTGKTMLARAVATESEANFMHVNGPELMSKWIGESEANVREVFETARETAPTVLFFDELDALLPERGSTINESSNRVTGQFLTELDGVTDDGDVIVIGATNRPDCIDSAILRENRLGEPLTVELPNESARQSILESHTHEKPVAEEVDLETIASQTTGETGSTLASLCDRAATLALQEAIEAETVDTEDDVPAKIHMRHFEEAMDDLNIQTNEFYDPGNPASAD